MNTKTILLLIGAYLLWQHFSTPQPENPLFVGPINNPQPGDTGFIGPLPQFPPNYLN